MILIIRAGIRVNVSKRGPSNEMKQPNECRLKNRSIDALYWIFRIHIYPRENVIGH